MEKFSNSTTELVKMAQTEIALFELDQAEKTIVFFEEFPAIAISPFRINLSKTSDGQLISRFRLWDTDYDLKRWQNKIYNLSRLRIVSKKHLLSKTQSDNIMQVINGLAKQKLPNTLHDDSLIVLDGFDWELGISTENIQAHYKWRLATKDVELFVPLIDLLLEFHSIKK